MACDIQFIVREGGKDEIISLSTNLEEVDFNNPDILDVVVDKLFASPLTKRELGGKLKVATKGYFEYSGDTLPNYNLQTLKKEFPNISFGNGNYQILLVNSNRVGGKSLCNVIQKEGDQKLFVLNEQGLYRFANYTLLMDAIYEKITSQEEDEFLTTTLPSIYSKLKDTKTFKIPKVQDKFLISFIENQSQYFKKLNPVDFAKIDNYLRTLLNKQDRFLTGRSDLINTIETILVSGGNKIEIDYFLKILNKSKSVSKEDKKFIKDNKDNISKYDIKRLFRQYFLNDTSYQLVDITNKYLFVKNGFQSFIEKHGYSFETVLTKRPLNEKYKGFYIYEFKDDNNETFYIASRDIISTHSPNFKHADSLEKLYEYIDQKEPLLTAESFDAIDSTLLGIQQVKLPKFYGDEAVIRKYNYQRIGAKFVDTKTNRNLGQFRREVESKYDEILEDPDTHQKITIGDRIKQLIDDPQYMQYFFYYSHLQNSEISREDQLYDLSLAEDIVRNGKWEYYSVIHSTKEHSKSQNYYVTLIKIDESDLYKTSKYTSDRPKSIDVQFAAIQQIFSNLGVKVQILNNLPKGVNQNAKAFLKNGIIYLNAKVATYSDVMHEYTHLFLQLLKANNIDNYNKIINRFKELLKEDTIKEYKDKYAKENLSDDELIEEIFADKYGNFLQYGTKDKSLISIFGQTTKEICDIQNINPFEFENSGNDNIFTFMNSFSTYMKDTIKQVGFGLPIVSTNYHAAEDYIYSDKFPTAEDINNTNEQMFRICN